MDSVKDWDAVLKLELADAVVANVSAEDGAFVCTDAELLYANAAGVQRAALAQIAKVNREGSEIVISSADAVLIRGPIGADQASLVSFFDLVKIATSKAKVVKPSSLVPAPPVTAGTTAVAASVSSFAMDTSATSSHSSFTPSTSAYPDAKVTSSVPVTSVLNAQAPVAGRPVARDQVAGSSMDRLPLEYAGFWVRTVAFVIDSLIVYLAQTLLQLALGLQTPMNLDEMQQFSRLDSRATTGWLLFTVLTLLWQWLYYALMEASSRQGTLGKMAMGLAVTDLEGRRLNFARASGRFLGKGLANALAGVVMLIGLVMLATNQGPAGADPNIMFTTRALMGFLRSVLLGLLILLASNVMAAFTKRRQALQDLVSGCVVVQKIRN